MGTQCTSRKRPSLGRILRTLSPKSNKYKHLDEEHDTAEDDKRKCQKDEAIQCHKTANGYSFEIAGSHDSIDITSSEDPNSKQRVKKKKSKRKTFWRACRKSWKYLKEGLTMYASTTVNLNVSAAVASALIVNDTHMR